MPDLTPYRKTIAAVVVGALGWATAVVVSAPAAITAGEWVQGAGVLAAACGVYAVSNTPDER